MFRLLNDAPRYRVNLMLHGDLFRMLPLPDDAGLTYGAAEAEVVSSDRPYLLAVEAWLTVLDGCGKLTDTHIYR